MTRTEAYATGFIDGCRWAEQDIRDGIRDAPDYISRDAYEIGVARGYRDTWARFEAGTLTYTMFESGPL